MRISVPDWCYYGKLGDPAAYYETLRSMGVDGVEMVDPKRYSEARTAGLEILNLCAPGMTKGLNRREHHAELLPQIREAIEAARANRIPLVIVFSGNRAGQADHEGMDNCRRALEALLPSAEAARVTLGFEMLNSFDHVDYQADHGRYGFTLARRVNSPWLKLVYDIYHMERMGDDSARDIATNLDTIAHLHVAESPNRDRPLADGTIRYSHIVPAVSRAGYRGYWGLEFVPRGNPQDDLRASIALFQELAP